MEKITKPNVSTIASGKNLIVKQMEAESGNLLPQHSASLESVLHIVEGEGILYIEGKEIQLKPGFTFIIPEQEKHQIRAISKFKGLHIMPKTIKFNFFNN